MASSKKKGGSKSGHVKEMEREIEKLKKQLQKEKKLRKKLAPMSHKNQPVLIPRPKGSAGDLKRGFSLIKEMELDSSEEKQDLYASIQRWVRKFMNHAGMDLELHYSRQPTDKLAKVFKVARDMFPILGNFQNDWATAEYVKQYLNNHRKHAKKTEQTKRQVLARVAKLAQNGNNEDDEQNEDENGATDECTMELEVELSSAVDEEDRSDEAGSSGTGSDSD
ncbi:hypothetical protein EW146_g7642 [Bondarzewia mesenterica]|uniref:Uncharacterized protein n=1 Tax=Bondarzewia mesenterica TaxID=1095465 RepID=A0A4S4LQU5_9AGAM|nr:hypothetical protein EW146_g7642 [Bondarzewia mesenterica]